MIFLLMFGKQLILILKTLQILMKYKEILDYFQLLRLYKLTQGKFLFLEGIKRIIQNLNKVFCLVLIVKKIQEGLHILLRKLILNHCLLLKDLGVLIQLFKIKYCSHCKILVMKMMNKFLTIKEEF